MKFLIKILNVDEYTSIVACPVFYALTCTEIREYNDVVPISLLCLRIG